ncbi:MoxR family ATPase [Bacillota bacterium LX-D]|nr:MoxR family ATPase [Bacillota bacterium LX-D]
MFANYQELSACLIKQNYFINDNAALILFLAYKMNKPLLIEGPAGVGKTELAKVLAEVTGSTLIRLQCYEGLDEGRALYEWNYQMQLLYLEARRQNLDWDKLKEDIYTEEYILPRPLLKALRCNEPVVLLIDELDKSDEEFESFLLELLAEFQISIPELGTIKAKNKPTVIVTSNNSREFSEALKRRCFYLYLDYPDLEREMTIIRSKLPGISEKLATQVTTFVQNLRYFDLKKRPSIVETIDFAQALLILNSKEMQVDEVKKALTILLKYQEDVSKIVPKLEQILSKCLEKPR